MLRYLLGNGHSPNTLNVNILNQGEVMDALTSRML